MPVKIQWKWRELHQVLQKYWDRQLGKVPEHKRVMEESYYLAFQIRDDKFFYCMCGNIKFVSPTTL